MRTIKLVNMTNFKKNPKKTESFLMEKRGTRLQRKPIFQPAVNIDEDEQEYVLYMGLPGMERKDFEITISNGMLTIKANQLANARCYRDRCEYSFSEWKRTFLLPEDADVIFSGAHYQNGELVIHIPKGDASKKNESSVIYVY